MRKTIICFIFALFIVTPLFQVLAYNPNYRFTDQERDGESGLYNFDAREYNPNTGRFNQPDPVLNNLTNPQALKQQTRQDIQELLKDPQNLNPYSYTRNNPIRYVDPTGQWFGEFFTGQQSWNSFQMELGEAAMYANPLMSTVIDHPYATGAILGIGSGILVAGATLAAGGSITCGILCGSTAAEVATTGGTTVATQGDKLIQGAQNNLDKLNSAVSVAEKSRAILNSWSQQTFNSISESIRYHWTEHGKPLGLSIEQYTKQGLEYIINNSDKAFNIIDRINNTALKVKSNPGGIWTEAGKIISYWIDKKY